jgi:transposase
MSPAYWAAVLEHLPEAAIVFDRFHLTKRVNEKLDDVRRAMGRKAAGLMKKTGKGIRYLLLTRRENVGPDQLPRLEEALKTNEPLNLGYRLWEALGWRWRQRRRDMAHHLKEGCQWAADSGVRQRQQLAKTLTAHARGILNWGEHRISNGQMEGMGLLNRY